MTSSTRAARSGQGFWNAVLRVFDMSLGQMLWSRRTVFMALATGAPVVIAVLLRVITKWGCRRSGSMACPCRGRSFSAA